MWGTRPQYGRVREGMEAKLHSSGQWWWWRCGGRCSWRMRDEEGPLTAACGLHRPLRAHACRKTCKDPRSTEACAGRVAGAAWAATPTALASQPCRQHRRAHPRSASRARVFAGAAWRVVVGLALCSRKARVGAQKVGRICGVGWGALLPQHHGTWGWVSAIRSPNAHEGAFGSQADH